MLNETLEALLTAARQDEALRQRLLQSRESRDPMTDFCAAATEAGYPMEPGELFAAGQEYTDNLLKSCNGGAEYPIEGWEDSYEMFLAALGRYEAGEDEPSVLQ